MKISSKLALRTLRGLLRPVVRFCIRHSLKLQEIQEALKLVLVQLASEELGSESSASKISAITGVHRRDITRLLKSDYSYLRPENTIARVIALWQFDERFTDKKGKPRALDCEGKDSEFAQLVRLVNGNDLSSYTVLFELERSGAVRKVGSGLTLLTGEVIYSQDVESGLELLEADSNDLGEAVEENLFQAGTNLHLRTEFDKIPPGKLPEIKKWLVTEGTKFHEHLRNHLRCFDADFNGSIPDDQSFARVVCSAFSFTEEIKNKKDEQ